MLSRHIKGKYSDSVSYIKDSSEFYRDQTDKGFHVASVRSSISGIRHEMDHMEIETPYSYQGRSVFAKTSVDCESAGDTIHREYSCELYVIGENALDKPRNIEDASGMSAGKCIADQVVLQDREGNSVPYLEALDAVGLYSAAASGHPHVMSYDECKPIYDKSHEKINAIFANMGEPIQELSEDVYLAYLDKCEAEMKTASGLYIGEITSPEDVKSMRLTVPSFYEYSNKIDKESALQRECDIVSTSESEDTPDYQN